MIITLDEYFADLNDSPELRCVTLYDNGKEANSIDGYWDDSRTFASDWDA